PGQRRRRRLPDRPAGGSLHGEGGRRDREPAVRTLFEKVWDAHVVRSAPGEPDLLYVDLHLVHEVTSPQAFEGLRLAGRTVRRADLTLATEDHNVPTLFQEREDGGTRSRNLFIEDPVSRTQVDTLRANCEEFGVRLFP